MSDGWIKLHRRFLQWEWWDDHNVTRLFLYLLLRANYNQGNWKGATYSPGQVITSLATIKRQTGLSLRSIRTALEKMEATSELTIKTTNRFSIINLSNWSNYQDKNDTRNDTPVDKRPTTGKEGKEDKNIYKGKENFRTINGKRVPCDDRGNVMAEDFIKTLETDD